MVVSRDKTPSAQEMFMQMAKAAGLRGRLLVTIGLLILVRLGIFIPVPGIDRTKFVEVISNNPALGFFRYFYRGRAFYTRNFCTRNLTVLLMPPLLCSC